jgi:uncharacterized protein
MENITNIKFIASKSGGEVSGILILPEKPKALLLFAHGAGAPMDHPFMNKAAEYLEEENIGTLRFNFPYTEKKSKRIDPAPILMETIRSSVNAAKDYSGDIPLFAGGKSMGGRMTSQTAAANPLDEIKGLIFFGFPLHAPGKESTDRAEHLFKVKLPMLFLQGTRDKLAKLELLKPVIKKIGKKADLYIIEGADHSFHLLKSAGKSDDEVLKEISNKVSNWIDSVLNK